MSAVQELASSVGIAKACAGLGLPRATYYRQLSPQREKTKEPRRSQPRALSEAEREAVLDILNSERFADRSPAEIYATLLDERVYLCSRRTMYRILAQAGEVRERRNQLRHPEYQKPELLATEPNQVWSWDITKLLGPAKWTYYHLYVIIDIYSRYVVGWMVATCESASLAERLIEETCKKQGIVPGQLTIHADRGSSMKSKAVAHLLADLGITKTHSRPHVSDDNPFSESQFKTLKYCPTFPSRFGSIEDARAFCRSFFPWYNNDHRHSGIGLLTPSMVHHGQAIYVVDSRNAVLAAAYEAHPERFVRKIPVVSPPPEAVWINPPKEPSRSNPCQGIEEAAQQRTLDTTISPTILGTSGQQHGSCPPGEGTCIEHPIVTGVDAP